MFSHWNMDDGIKANNGVKAVFRKGYSGHVSQYEPGMRHQEAGAVDLNGRNVDSCHLEMFGKDSCCWSATPAAEVEYSSAGGFLPPDRGEPRAVLQVSLQVGVWSIDVGNGVIAVRHSLFGIGVVHVEFR